MRRMLDDAENESVAQARCWKDCHQGGGKEDGEEEAEDHKEDRSCTIVQEQEGIRASSSPPSDCYYLNLFSTSAPPPQLNLCTSAPEPLHLCTCSSAPLHHRNL